jgi:hypothetical protein
MLQFELLRDKGILVISPDSPLAEGDFANLAREIDPFIAANGNLSGIMIRADVFPGWDSFAAMFSHLKFIGDHHRKIERIAVVTDSPFLKALPPMAGFFVQPEIKQFGRNDQNAALVWLEAK